MSFNKQPQVNVNLTDTTGYVIEFLSWLSLGPGGCVRVTTRDVWKLSTRSETASKIIPPSNINQDVSPTATKHRMYTPQSQSNGYSITPTIVNNRVFTNDSNSRKTKETNDAQTCTASTDNVCCATDSVVCSSTSSQTEKPKIGHDSTNHDMEISEDEKEQKSTNGDNKRKPSKRCSKSKEQEQHSSSCSKAQKRDKKHSISESTDEKDNGKQRKKCTCNKRHSRDEKETNSKNENENNKGPSTDENEEEMKIDEKPERQDVCKDCRSKKGLTESSTSVDMEDKQCGTDEFDSEDEKETNTKNETSESSTNENENEMKIDDTQDVRKDCTSEKGCTESNTTVDMEDKQCGTDQHDSEENTNSKIVKCITCKIVCDRNKSSNDCATEITTHEELNTQDPSVDSTKENKLTSTESPPSCNVSYMVVDITNNFSNRKPSDSSLSDSTDDSHSSNNSETCMCSSKGSDKVPPENSDTNMVSPENSDSKMVTSESEDVKDTKKKQSVCCLTCQYKDVRNNENTETSFTDCGTEMDVDTPKSSESVQTKTICMDDKCIQCILSKCSNVCIESDKSTEMEPSEDGKPISITQSIRDFVTRYLWGDPICKDNATQVTNDNNPNGESGPNQKEICNCGNETCNNESQYEDNDWNPIDVDDNPSNECNTNSDDESDNNNVKGQTNLSLLRRQNFKSDSNSSIYQAKRNVSFNSKTDVFNDVVESNNHDASSRKKSHKRNEKDIKKYSGIADDSQEANTSCYIDTEEENELELKTSTDEENKLRIESQTTLSCNDISDTENKCHKRLKIVKLKKCDQKK